MLNQKKCRVVGAASLVGIVLMVTGGCASQQVSTVPEEAAAAVPLEEQVSVVRTDRYTLANTAPLLEQKEPMVAIVHMRFAQEVSTVGQAVRELLEGSGYRLLLGDDRVEMQDRILMTQRLPAVHQELGPVTLQDALKVLGGRAWDVNIDHVYRLVWFSVSEEAAR